jgi:DNA-binding NarL/FixJ family response regulator
MNGFKVMIVDDSPFTVSVLREILEKHGHEAVGAAGTLEEVKEVATRTNPELVTMDMTLPGTDGFECTRAIYAINPMTKVIAISSMKDDSIVSEAIRNNISAYIQKPIDEDELVAAINQTMASGDLFETVEQEYFAIYKEALHSGIHTMTKSNITFLDEHEPDDPFTSEGITCVISMVGKFSGRMLMSMSKVTAAGLAVSILKREPHDDYELTNLLMELVNVVSGNAVSKLNTIINKRNRIYNLRLSPPSILTGKDMLVYPPGYTTRTVVVDSVFGKMLFNVGFTKGDKNWI